jgi:tetratricopeptide (TPR) repeat protein
MATILDHDFVNEPKLTQTHLYRDVIKKFRLIVSASVHLHLLFALVAIAELFIGCFSLSNQTVFFAIFASLFFATFFSYFVILFYLQARKPEQLKHLIDEFITSCRANVHQHHPSVAESLIRFSAYLEDFEWEFYKTSSPLISRLSAYLYWEDIFQTKQLLLKAAIEEYIQQVHLTPTDIEVHASLGNAYVALSKLYRQPIQKEQHPRAYLLKKIQLNSEEKSKLYSKLAIEEYIILSHYASNDPWIHEQMALGYKDLGLPAEETKEIETLLKIRPQDKDILLRLGTLYFAQGMNAKGLFVYEELKKMNFIRAEELIASYGKV